MLFFFARNFFFFSRKSLLCFASLEICEEGGKEFLSCYRLTVFFAEEKEDCGFFPVFLSHRRKKCWLWRGRKTASTLICAFQHRLNWISFMHVCIQAFSLTWTSCRQKYCIESGTLGTNCRVSLFTLNVPFSTFCIQKNRHISNSQLVMAISKRFHCFYLSKSFLVFACSFLYFKGSLFRLWLFIPFRIPKKDLERVTELVSLPRIKRCFSHSSVHERA